MASYLQRVILVALILSIAIPISFSHKEISDDESDWDWENELGDNRDHPEIGNDDSEMGRYLKDQCSHTKNSSQCWNIIKPVRNKFTTTDSRDVASVAIDLAIEKSVKINNKLNQLHHESGDNSLKEKYLSCSRNYNDAHHNLDIVKENLDSEDYRGIQDRVEKVKNEVRSCKHQFGKGSYDPAHIWNRNKKFRCYVDIVEIAIRRFMKEKDCDNDEKH